LKSLKQTQSNIALWILISPAIKLPFQATLENIEPTKAADIAEINVIPLIGIHDPVVTLSEAQAFAQLASQTSALAAKKTEND
jgi:predicted esterase